MPSEKYDPPDRELGSFLGKRGNRQGHSWVIFEIIGRAMIESFSVSRRIEQTFKYFFQDRHSCFRFRGKYGISSISGSSLHKWANKSGSFTFTLIAGSCASVLRSDLIFIKRPTENLPHSRVTIQILQPGCLIILDEVVEAVSVAMRSTTACGIDHRIHFPRLLHNRIRQLMQAPSFQRRTRMIHRA